MGEWESGSGEVGERGSRGEELSSSAKVSPSVSVSQPSDDLSSDDLSSAPPLPNPPAPHPRAKAKHTPERTCAACRTKMAQSDLYRIRKTPQGWTMDQSVKVGRSAYLCSSPYCHVEKRLKRIFGVQAAQIATHMSEVLKALEGPKEK